MPLALKYFVLKPAGKSPHAEAARQAMFAYAAAIEDTDPQLADELCFWAETESRLARK